MQTKRAVITGASAGIGAATARALSAAGYDLVLGARRLDRLAELRQELSGTSVEIVELDVTDPKSCKAFAAAAGRADVLVNNAGLARGTERLVEAREEDWREMVETNLLGLMRLTRHFLPSMIAAKTGIVINVGSVAGLEPYAGGTAYGATKAGVKALSKALRHELLGTGVRVSLIEPGAVQTEFSLVRFSGDAERAEKVYQGFTPLTAEDVAETIAFVATRPPHVDVEEVVLYPTAQASTTAFSRTSS